MSKIVKFEKIVVSVVIGIGLFFGGYYFGNRGFEFDIKTKPLDIKILNKSPSKSAVDFELFWEVWDKINVDYLEKPVDPQKMLYGAIGGMVNSLGDPYSSFLPPQVNKTVTSAINGTYEGIGAELGFKDSQLIVVAPLEGSPAKNAGVRPGDKILEIDGVGTAGITINDAVAKIRGPANTTVRFKLQRGELEPYITTIKRGVVVTESVIWKDKGDGVAYIRINQFGEDTNKQWSRVTSEVNVQMRQLDVVIIDVRGNPGGYLQSAVYIANEFFHGKPVVYEETPNGKQLVLNADNRVGVFEKVPAVFVLIDGGSASASEILAAALKEQAGAVLVGAKSFGKGTIQNAEDFKDGSGLHLTIAKWLTPRKEWVHKKGLEPDVAVEATEADLTNGIDKQLDKAVELAKQI